MDIDVGKTNCLAQNSEESDVAVVGSSSGNSDVAIMDGSGNNAALISTSSSVHHRKRYVETISDEK